MMSNWFNENRDGIAVCTRIRLARNLKNLPFPHIMSHEQKDELKNKVKSVINNTSSPLIKQLKFIDMANVPEIEINSMVERHVISPEFAHNIQGKAIILSQDESISIMVGEEDHLRIQVILGGLQLENAFSTAKELDEILNESLTFAFDEDLGYLTECPTNLGTALRASVMLHLPFCEKLRQIQSISEAVSKMGFTVRGIYGEGSNTAANLYQISNQITLGITENNAIENLSLIIAKICEKEENSALKIEKISLEDKIFRALGILKNCRILQSDEMMNLLSLIILGCRMGILNNEYKPIKVLIEAQSNMLMRNFGILTPEERDIKRAEYVRECFKI